MSKLTPVPVLLIAGCMAASAQCTPTPINAGQTLTGTLTSACPSTRRAGSYAKLYSFYGSTNYAITIAISSPAFDAYGYLVMGASVASGTGGSVVATDDESGGNHNVLIKHTATSSATYTIEVTSATAASGNFTVSLAVVTSGVPVINSGGVVNGASYRAGIAPGSWITIRGQNLSTTTRVWQQSDFKGSSLPLSLDGVSVKVNNKDAAVYYISPTQINALAPQDTSTGSISVTVTNSAGASVPSTATLQRYAPGWFAFSQNSRYPAAVHLDGAYVGPATLFGSAATAIPAIPGETILLFGTGFGPTNPAADPLQTLSGALPLATPGDLSITVGGAPAQVAFAGLTGNGLYQFNIVVPALSDGEHSLIASIGGVQTQTVQLAVKTPPPIPTITAISPKDWVWGQHSSVTLTGTSLATVTKVELSDPLGLRVESALSATSTNVTFKMTVDGDVAPGEYTVSVVNATGRSNAMPFTVWRGSPAITRVAPAVVYPDRVYAGSSLYSAPKDTFGITGTDVLGVNRIEITPSAGLAVAWSNSTTSISGVLAVGADTPLGPHQLTVSSPAATSNALTFTVQSPPATAPVITGVTMATPTLSSTGGIKYSGSIQFTDSDGDIRTATNCPSQIFLAFLMPACPFVRLTTVSPSLATFDITGAFLNLPGQTSGTIDFTYSVGILAYLRFTGASKLAVTLYDTAGHPSNTVIVDVTNWLVPTM